MQHPQFSAQNKHAFGEIFSLARIPWRQCAAIRFTLTRLKLHHAHDRHKSQVPGVARNPKFLALDHKTMHVCCAKSSIDRDCGLVLGNLFDCARSPPFSVAQWRKGTLAMFETMTAVMGLVGAAIFLAHAFEGIRSRV
jgi:hypothetical protein